jgi:hypothetical protein
VLDHLSDDELVGLGVLALALVLDDSERIPFTTVNQK